MLFDLRGAGRRTTVKVVYLLLAVLMGGGLVLFGIGGDVSGGLVDAITERGATQDGGSESFRERAERAEANARAKPQDAAAWAAATRARFQYANAGEFFDQQQNAYTEQGKVELRRASQSWERYLALEPRQPDDSVANLMVQAYSQVGLNQPEKAVQAQEIITEARPRETTFAQLSVLAYQAGQTRKGDLARKRALELSDKADRNTLKSQLDAAKQQALQQQLQDATGGAGGAGTATPEAGGTGGAGSGGGSGSGGSGGGNNGSKGGGGDG
jgi:hypothetical protein